MKSPSIDGRDFFSFGNRNKLYTDFHASTIPRWKYFKYFSPDIRGPLIRPWTIFGFSIFSPLVLGQSLSIYPISRFYDIGKHFLPNQGPLDPLLDRIF